MSWSLALGPDTPRTASPTRCGAIDVIGAIFRAVLFLVRSIVDSGGGDERDPPGASPRFDLRPPGAPCRPETTESCRWMRPARAPGGRWWRWYRAGGPYRFHPHSPPPGPPPPVDPCHPRTERCSAQQPRPDAAPSGDLSAVTRQAGRPSPPDQTPEEDVVSGGRGCLAWPPVRGKGACHVRTGGCL